MGATRKREHARSIISHAGGYRVDFNYFTHGWNTTNYVPAWMDKSPKAEKGMSGFVKDQEVIWKAPLEGKGLLPIFDWERNFLLWAWTVDILSYSDILVSTGIRNHVRSKAMEKYPDEWKWIEKNVRDTGTTLWSHHLHVHVDFGTSGRPDGFDIDWEKPRDYLCCC